MSNLEIRTLLTALSTGLVFGCSAPEQRASKEPSDLDTGETPPLGDDNSSSFGTDYDITTSAQ